MKILGWVCLFIVLAGSAQGADVPKNAHALVFEPGWECDEGFFRQGSRCLAVVVPEHARLNLLGNGWECNAGYVRKEQACVVLRAPAHAQLDPFGQGWNCWPGYRRQDDRCVPEGLAEKTEEMPVDVKSLPIAATGPEGTACLAGYNKCTSACCHPVHDLATNRELKRSDFLARCSQACAEAKVRCAADASPVRCDAFNDLCPELCPDTVQDLALVQRAESTNAKSVCEKACRQGMSRCTYHARKFETAPSL